MKHIEKVVIDGSKINNVYDFHSILKANLNFPQYYGDNLDALWDMLTSWVDLPLIVEWKDFDETKKKLGCEADQILELFLRAESELKGLRIKIT